MIVVGKFGIQILDGLPHQRVYVEGFGCWRSFECWRVCLTDSLLIFGRSKFQASVDVLSCKGPWVCSTESVVVKACYKLDNRFTKTIVMAVMVRL